MKITITVHSTESVILPILTETEILVEAIWVDILDLPNNAIHGNSNFFELGGDSMSSLQFVGDIRRRGWTISVREIFDCPILHEVAKCMKKVQSKGDLIVTNMLFKSTNKRSTIIWLHGLGETPDTWESFANRLGSEIKVGLKLIVPLGAGLNWLGDIEQSITDLEAIIDKESNDASVEKIIIGGFSQGGAVAPLVAKLFCGEHRKIKAVISLSSWVLDELHDFCVKEKEKDKGHCSIPLFIGHGTMDEQVSDKQSEAFLNVWGEGVSVINRKLYPGMGHTCNKTVEMDIIKFIQQTLHD